MKNSPEKSSVQTGNVRLTYLAYGNPASPPMVLVHALFMSANDWSDVAAAFSDRYRIYALNQRGHGDSDWPGEYSFTRMAEDVVGFLDALHLNQVVLVGHSLGGIVSYFVAATHPDRVLALILEEGPPPRVGGGPFDFGPRPAGKLSFDWSAVTAVMALLNQPDPAWWDLAGHISAPTLVIGGGSTSHVPQAWNAALVENIPNSRLVTLGGGHFVHQNRPQRFISEMAVFLSGLETHKGG